MSVQMLVAPRPTHSVRSRRSSAPLPAPLPAPLSATDADETAIAIELVHVIHSWIADIAPTELRDESDGCPIDARSIPLRR
jgi:hypothetical protein